MAEVAVAEEPEYKRDMEAFYRWQFTSRRCAFARAAIRTCDAAPPVLSLHHRLPSFPPQDGQVPAGGVL